MSRAAPILVLMIFFGLGSARAAEETAASAPGGPSAPARPRDVFTDPAVVRLRADLADELLHVSGGFGPVLLRGERVVEVGLFLSGLPEAVEPSASAVAEAERASSLLIASWILLPVGSAMIGAAPAVAFAGGGGGIAGGLFLGGLGCFLASLITSFLSTSAFYDSIRLYNDDLVRGRLDPYFENPPLHQGQEWKELHEDPAS